VYHCAQLSYTTRHRTVRLFSLLTSKQSLYIWCCLLDGRATCEAASTVIVWALILYLQRYGHVTSGSTGAEGECRYASSTVIPSQVFPSEPRTSGDEQRQRTTVWLNGTQMWLQPPLEPVHVFSPAIKVRHTSRSHIRRFDLFHKISIDVHIKNNAVHNIDRIENKRFYLWSDRGSPSLFPRRKPVEG